jgi:capsid protein
MELGLGISYSKISRNFTKGNFYSQTERFWAEVCRF